MLTSSVSRARCCAEHTRSSLLRAGIAEAGRGLPEIEPGMPLPAGSGLDRRSFVLRGLGSALAVYGVGALRPEALVEGIEAAAASGAPPRVLVNVFLDGGADSLNMLFPAGDPLYRQYRPRLGLSAEGALPFSEDGRLFWHPSLAGLATLHGEGKVSVLPGVGYTGANQSHFTSRHYWEVGTTNDALRTGWLGRYLDRVGVANNPLQGLSLDNRLQPALATAKVPIASIDGPDRYDFWTRGVWGEVADRLLDAVGAIGALPSGGDAGLAAAAGVARQSHELYGRLAAFRPRDGKTPSLGTAVPYPASDDAFPRRLAGLAAMLAAGLPVRCVAITAPGRYDTHDNQPDELANGLRLTADSLLAFQRDLEARGLADRVLVHVWSEFGRRAKENGSSGTDHGAAGLGFVVGTSAAGRMVGEFPGLQQLDERGNLRATSDFRSVYTTLLEGWLGTDAAAVIPGAAKFARVPLLK